MCEVSPGLNATQVTPGHILKLLLTLYENYSLHKMCRQIPLNMGFTVWRDRLYWTELNFFLAYEYGGFEESVQRSRIGHEKTENGQLSCKNCTEEDVTGSFH